ncbi:galactose mutarotase [Pedobacter psychrophilus]|uniref:Aldose 1-epimerase n=1 Tax=Pedobacter psychrophilus TaxID=1826909 RepID=A0A179DHV6_9SPHI|nr:aldose epimerase family protein [Pedobacter psychrophilus]OAQ40382.1 galactose mutarotase [Pedobacter psychrophilus]
MENKLFTLTNNTNIKVTITNFGGRVVSILVSDKEGNMIDVALGYDDLTSYQKENEPYFGAIIGRYGNRIAKGKFSLDGKEYQLEINNGPNALHGGSDGFHNKFWNAEQPNNHTLILTCFSADGEGGFPGNLHVKVVYSLTDNNGLQIDYSAKSDKKTIINLTNHTYFNLNGVDSNTDILNHILEIDADNIVEIDETSIATGNLLPVLSTAFDFKNPMEIGSRIEENHEQLTFGNGYDHTYVFNKREGTLEKVAYVYSRQTGISLAVFTEEPGMQFYTGNFLTGEDNDGKNGNAYPFRSGFCLETQHFPDSPNHPNFPSTVLNVGEVYESTTIYEFGIQK